MNNEIIGFKETQINLSDSTLNLVRINFNNNDNKCLMLTDDVAILYKLDINGVSIFSFTKHAFC